MADTAENKVEGETKRDIEEGEVNGRRGHGRVVERVIEEEEALAFQDRGLGRGVDATNPTPWLNKREMQVRKVVFSDIIGTEEGNLYQGFVNEVESTQHLQTSLSASVPVNQLVSLGIDSELSRSYSVTQKSVGRKIITRTISFKPTFDQTSRESKEATFEQRLSDWILQQSKDKEVEKQFRGEQEKEKPKSDADKGENDQDITIKGNGESKGTFSAEDCYELCHDFVCTFSVTHYVHSLELGASHYRVMSQEEYSTQISGKAKLGAGQLADIALENKKTLGTKKYKNQTTKVGRMKHDDDDDSGSKKKWSWRTKHEDKDDSDSKKEEVVLTKAQEITSVEDEVKRGTIGEAVVGVKLQPISSLVSNNVKLRIQLQKALQKYIHEKQQVKFGPFYIACDEDRLYLAVNKAKDFEVEATYDLNKATQFFIVRCDEGDNHFHIVYEPPMSFDRHGSRKKFVTRVGDPDHMPVISRYLCATVNWRGRNKRNHPLRMSLDGQSTNSRLAIHCRKNSFHDAADLTEWVNEKEVFFINCQERSVTTPVSSYLCAYAAGRTGCKPTVQSHDEKNKFMLFRLLTPSKKHSTTMADEIYQDADTHGPFLIKNPPRAGSTSTVYLKVGPKSKTTERRTVDAITDKDSASQFYVKYDRKNGKYFEIFYGDGDNKLYLSATTDDHRDNRSRSLQVQSDAGGAWSYLSLCNEKLKLVKDRNEWLNCKESKPFAISCYVKPAQAKKGDKSYLIISPSDILGKERYSICCKSKIDYKKQSEFMQFQLEEPDEAPQVEDAQQSQNQQHGFQQQAAAAPTQEGSVTSHKVSVIAEITPQ